MYIEGADAAETIGTANNINTLNNSNFFHIFVCLFLI